MLRAITLLVLALAIQSIACDAGDRCDKAELLVDQTLVSPSPVEFQQLSQCEPRNFDISAAINDDGSNTIAWLLNYQPGQHNEPDAINRLAFTLDPCTNPKAVSGEVVTLEAFVLNAAVPLTVLADSDELKSFATKGLVTASALWFIGIGDCRAACQ